MTYQDIFANKCHNSQLITCHYMQSHNFWTYLHYPILIEVQPVDKYYNNNKWKKLYIISNSSIHVQLTLNTSESGLVSCNSFNLRLTKFKYSGTMLSWYSKFSHTTYLKERKFGHISSIPSFTLLAFQYYADHELILETLCS